MFFPAGGASGPLGLQRWSNGGFRQGVPGNTQRHMTRLRERDRRPVVTFFLVLAVITGIRLLLAGFCEPGVDEAHYVLFGRHLAWGYLDHPPLVALTARIGSLVADEALAARLVPILCSVLSLLVLRRLALELYDDERIALGAVLLLLLMPYEHLLMVALLPDATLNLFWCLTLLFFWKALHGKGWTWWLVTGACFGLALLSKYHAMLLPLCLFGYLLASDNYRHWLLRPQPWLALFVGLLLFVPNILWNMRHDWISYRFQFSRGGGEHFNLDRVFEILGVQAAVWSPFIFLLLLVVFLLTLLRWKNEKDAYLFWTSAPVFLFFYGAGMFNQVLPHWVAPGWWSGALLVSVVLCRAIQQDSPSSKIWRVAAWVAAITGFIMSALVYLALFFPLGRMVYKQVLQWTTLPAGISIHPELPVHYPDEKDLTNELFGWQEAADGISAVRNKLPRPARTFLFSDRFYTLGQLGVFLEPETVLVTLREQVDQYRLWHSPGSLKGWDGLYIDDNRFDADFNRYRSLFDWCAETGQFVTGKRGPYVVRKLQVFYCRGYNGRLVP